MDTKKSGYTMELIKSTDFNGKKIIVTGLIGSGKSTVLYKSMRLNIRAKDYNKCIKIFMGKDFCVWLCVSASSLIYQEDRMILVIKSMQEKYGDNLFVILTKTDTVRKRQAAKALGLLCSLGCKVIDI